MGDVHHRRAGETLVQTGDFDARIDPQSRVEIRQWFVEQKHFRLTGDGTADRDALALPAG